MAFSKKGATLALLALLAVSSECHGPARSAAAPPRRASRVQPLPPGRFSRRRRPPGRGGLPRPAPRPRLAAVARAARSAAPCVLGRLAGGTGGAAVPGTRGTRASCARLRPPPPRLPLTPVRPLPLPSDLAAGAEARKLLAASSAPTATTRWETATPAMARPIARRLGEMAAKAARYYGGFDGRFGPTGRWGAGYGAGWYGPRYGGYGYVPVTAGSDWYSAVAGQPRYDPLFYKH
jgi:hypothetical protein